MPPPQTTRTNHPPPTTPPHPPTPQPPTNHQPNPSPQPDNQTTPENRHRLRAKLPLAGLYVQPDSRTATLYPNVCRQTKSQDSPRLTLNLTRQYQQSQLSQTLVVCACGQSGLTSARRPPNACPIASWLEAFMRSFVSRSVWQDAPVACRWLSGQNSSWWA